MSPIRKLILIGTASLFATAPAIAGPWQKAHPRRAEVNHRLNFQARRINAGIRQGQLTHAEAHTLRVDDRNIRGQERAMARLDGGHITRGDQRVLNQEENGISRTIYADRHN